MTAQLNTVIETLERDRQRAQPETAVLPEGYVMRPARLDDIEAAVAMFNAYARRMVGADQFTAEEYRKEWTVPGVNLDTDVRVVVAPDGQVVGCMEVWDLWAPHVRVNLWMRVHPEHEDKGIGESLVRWAEGRARQAIAKAPVGARVSMMTGVQEEDKASLWVFEQAGLQRIRYSWRMVIDMQAAPPKPERPQGIVVRPMRVGQDKRAVLQAVRDAFRDHWGYVELPFEDEYSFWQHHVFSDDDFDPTLWFLAMDGDRIAGISLCRQKADDDPEMGWVNTLGVLRPWRRKGLGLALLRHTFDEFYRRGKRRVGLGVDAQSLTGATRLYEKAGMHVARVYRTYEKELRPGKELSTQAVDA